MTSNKAIAIGLLSSFLCLSSAPGFADDKTKLLDQQAQAAYQQGNYTQAIALTEQVLAITREQYGEKNPDTLISMNNLAQLYRLQGSYDLAEPLLMHTLQLSKEVLGENNPDTLMTMNSLAELYQVQGRYQLAQPIFENVLQLNLKLLGEKHPNTLSSMNNLAELYSSEGEFTKAEPLFVKTLQLRIQLLGEKHQNTLITMNNLANLYRAQGRYELAEPLLTKALALRTATLGKKHPDTLLSMNNLAGLYMAEGRYELAEPLYKQGLQLSEEVLGEKHPDTLVSLNNLAHLYYNQGNYDLTEPLYIKNLQLAKEILGEKHPNTISSMNNLAILYKTQGRYELAEPLFEQALKLNTEVLGENHPVTLISMNNLAGLYKEQEKYPQAQLLYEKSVRLSEKILGDQHPDTLARIENLAALYELQKHYDLAEPLYIKAWQISKKRLGETHPLTLLSMNNLAWFYFSQQHYKKAAALLSTAAQLQQKTFGEKNPVTLVMMANLAEIYQASQQWDKAAQLWQKNLRLNNQFLNQMLWGAGEKTRLAYLQQQENYKNNYLTFYSLRNSPEMAKEALYFSLSRKGQLLRIASEVNVLAKHSQQPEVKALVEKFTDQKQQLANLTISGKADPGQIQALEEEINHLEMQLSQKVANFRRTQQDITPDDVLAKLSATQVLIDFLIFKEVDFKTQNYKAAQLIALVADKQHGVKIIKLGELNPIAAAIKTYRQNVLPTATGQLAKREEILKPASQKLYNLLWQPLLPHLAKKSEVYLIPDGILHLLPFKALMDKNGHYLAETQQITLLTSARDLVLPPITGKTNDSVIFAAPAFGNQEDKKTNQSNRNIATRLQDIYFAPLDGAAAEGQALSDLIKTKQPLQFFQGLQATETSVDAIKSPRLLHFATHGFFLENLPQTSAKPGRAGMVQELTAKLFQTAENPLTRSGLALTGANSGINGKKQTDGTDGILTALEVLALNLEGTDLVTLSACETGVGDIQVGEGVYSLNRAFQEAGAKSVLATLWSVADEQTKLFMQDFYGLVLNGMSPQQALQKTQLKFIHDKTIQDPFFWAAFTVVGI